MRRIFIGVVAAIVIAAGGWLGFNFYVQHRAIQQVDALFDEIRAGGGKANHGKVAFNLGTRTLTVEDIAGESTTQPQARVKIARLRAIGVRQSDPARFSADSIEISGIEATAEGAPENWKAVYKVPQITFTDYSGPIHGQRFTASNSLIETYRSVLQRFAAVTASSITAPTISLAFSAGTAAPGGGEATYSGLAIQGVREGRISTVKIDGVAFTTTAQQAGKTDKLSGNISNVVTLDFDASAAVAMLDPQQAGDDAFHRIYRQISAGPYVLTSELGLRARIDGITLDEAGIRPSKLQLQAIMSMLPTDRTVPPTPAQARELTAKLADLYEGIRIGNAEVRGLAVETPQGPMTLKAIRYNLENGQGDLAIEELDARSPNGPVKLERFVLKSLNAANLMRLTLQLSSAGQVPSPDQALGLFRVLEGAEVKNLVAPFKDSNKSINLDMVSLDWGQLVGSIPSKAHLVAKMTMPVDATNPALMPLLGAGIDKLVIDADLGAAWTEASGAFVVAPANIEIGNLLKAQARLTFANVPRAVFSLDLMHPPQEAAEIEAGPIELTLRDAGSVDLVVTQFARAQNLSREAARLAIIDKIKKIGKEIAAANPDGAAAVEAVIRFIETPGQTLAIKLTPLKVGVQLVTLLRTDALTALSQFRIEASTGL
ncbi:MAG: hypothetical protein HY852_13575 [Bradyrhizobium sp.]|uniref:hypothetical protein n=1 Tax=Bradyrhizobium sp. TaxID=376 RepID=UPI0025BB61AC|nr:hypothetical protein [Bradyrhizobium sp.]MBI5262837.1 hypothetical protein [Bradyrhizobium sp.]